MAIEHVDITDPDIHECKGAAAATAGQVPVATGTGTAPFTDCAFNTHGEMYVTGWTTVQAITAAVDATLATDSDYSKITGTSMWTAGHLERITFNVDELVVPTNGEYEVTFWASILSSVAGCVIGIKYAINDTTPYSTRKILSSAKSAGDIENVFASGIITSLTAGDTISVYVASDTTTNLTFKEAGLQVKLLDPA